MEINSSSHTGASSATDSVMQALSIRKTMAAPPGFKSLIVAFVRSLLGHKTGEEVEEMIAYSGWVSAQAFDEVMRIVPLVAQTGRHHRNTTSMVMASTYRMLSE